MHLTHSQYERRQGWPTQNISACTLNMNPHCTKFHRIQSQSFILSFSSTLKHPVILRINQIHILYTIYYINFVEHHTSCIHVQIHIIVLQLLNPQYHIIAFQINMKPLNKLHLPTNSIDSINLCHVY